MERKRNCEWKFLAFKGEKEEKKTMKVYVLF